MSGMRGAARPGVDGQASQGGANRARRLLGMVAEPVVALAYYASVAVVAVALTGVLWALACAEDRARRREPSTALGESL